MEDIRKTVRRNLANLMEGSKEFNSANKISAATKGAVGQTTVSNYLRQTYYGYPKLEHLESISKIFGLQTWHMLLPNLDVSNPPVILMSKAEQEFYAKMKEATKQLNKTEGVKQ